MATCSYCGRNISPNATACPRCGETDPSYRSSSDYDSDSDGDSENSGKFAIAAIGNIFLWGSIFAVYQASIHFGYSSQFAKTSAAIVGVVIAIPFIVKIWKETD